MAPPFVLPFAFSTDPNLSDKEQELFEKVRLDNVTSTGANDIASHAVFEARFDHRMDLVYRIALMASASSTSYADRSVDATRAAEKKLIQAAQSHRVLSFDFDLQYWEDSSATTPALLPDVPGAYEIWIHAIDDRLIQFSSLTSSSEYPMEFLVNDLKIRGWKRGDPIVLNSCNTGSFAAGPAQKLADMTGSVVYASRGYFFGTDKHLAPAFAAGGYKAYYPTGSN